MKLVLVCDCKNSVGCIKSDIQICPPRRLVEGCGYDAGFVVTYLIINGLTGPKNILEEKVWY